MKQKPKKHSNHILIRSSLRYIVRHPWQFGLSVLGIALGVAVVVAIDLANQSALKAFDRSLQQVSGQATHQIVGGPSGMPDTTYRDLRVQLGITQSTPIMEGYCTIPTEPPKVCRLLGIDPFAEYGMRPTQFSVVSALTEHSIRFLTTANSIMLPKIIADELGLTTGDSLWINVNNRTQSVIVAAVLNPQQQENRAALNDVIIADISTAQELLAMPGRITRIDLRLKSDANLKNRLDQLRSFLPAGAQLLPTSAQYDSGRNMTRSFQLNLAAMSVLALIVGMFLIYNTMTFSVVQRRTHIGLLRSLGVTRRELFLLMMVEAFIMGALGTMLGLGLGIELGRGLVKLVTQSINDLYFVLTVRELYVSSLSLAKGLGLGLIATLIAAIKPAREATTAPPRVTMLRSQVETNLLHNVPRFTVFGLGLIAIGTFILLYPARNIWYSYAGLMPLVSGLALLTPVTMIGLVRITSPLMYRMWGLQGRMATRSVISQMSRTAVAIAALSIAVATTVGVGTMVASFRGTVIRWMERLLTADIYVSTPGIIGRQSSGALDVDLAERLTSIPGVKHVNYYREVMLDTKAGKRVLLSAKIGEFRYNNFVFKAGQPETAWPAFQHEQAVLVSESYAYKYGVTVGDTVTIPTDRSRQSFRVVGVYYDYGTDLGLIAMSHWNYQRYFDDRHLSRILIYAKDGADISAIEAAIRRAAPTDMQIMLQSNRELLKASIIVFDRTFLITRVLQMLAVIVAFIGVLSSLMALQLERAREFGVLRAIGLTPQQLWTLVLVQTGFMGFIAGLLSLPIGNILAWVLIYVVNERSFGWSIEYAMMPHLLIQAIGLAVVAALVAGLYPAYKMATISPAVALREE